MINIEVLDDIEAMMNDEIAKITSEMSGKKLSDIVKTDKQLKEGKFVTKTQLK